MPPLDTLRSLGARMFLNKYIEDFGEVTQVDIDPRANQAVLWASLRGEPSPVRLEVGYRVEPEALVVVNFRCEREWIASALNRFLAGKRFDVSSGFAQAALGILL